MKAQRKEGEGSQARRAEVEGLKKKFVQLLRENKDRGVTLAQMHNMVQKRFGLKFDLNKLGYSKLKTFLQEIEGIYFDHGENANHIKARFKTPPKKKLKKKTEKKGNVLRTWDQIDSEEKKEAEGHALA